VRVLRARLGRVVISQRNEALQKTLMALGEVISPAMPGG
jgi:hypothetical protein